MINTKKYVRMKNGYLEASLEVHPKGPNGYGGERAEDEFRLAFEDDAHGEGLSRQKGVKGQQYGGVYGSVKVGRQGATKTLDASTGESDD